MNESDTYLAILDEGQEKAAREIKEIVSSHYRNLGKFGEIRAECPWLLGRTVKLYPGDASGPVNRAKFKRWLACLHLDGELPAPSHPGTRPPGRIE